jgi:hypothetical protein
MMPVAASASIVGLNACSSYSCSTRGGTFDDVTSRRTSLL